MDSSLGRMNLLATLAMIALLLVGCEEPNRRPIHQRRPAINYPPLNPAVQPNQVDPCPGGT